MTLRYWRRVFPLPPRPASSDRCCAEMRRGDPGTGPAAHQCRNWAGCWRSWGSSSSRHCRLKLRSGLSGRGARSGPVVQRNPGWRKGRRSSRPIRVWEAFLPEYNRRFVASAREAASDFRLLPKWVNRDRLFPLRHGRVGRPGSRDSVRLAKHSTAGSGWQVRLCRSDGGAIPSTQWRTARCGWVMSTSIRYRTRPPRLAPEGAMSAARSSPYAAEAVQTGIASANQAGGGR